MPCYVQAVIQTASQSWKGGWASWTDRCTVRIPARERLATLYLLFEVIEKGRKINGDLLVGQARVPLLYVHRASQQYADPMVCLRLIDPNTSLDSGRLWVQLAIEDPFGLEGHTVEGFPTLHDPTSPLASALFLRFGEGRDDVVPYREVILERFEPVQLHIKNSR